jgi:hypothetical protein
MLGLPFLRIAPLFTATLVTVALLALPVRSSAQEARGTISGTVRDTSGGVIPGASITVTNEAMGDQLGGCIQRPRLLSSAVPPPRHV